MRKLALASILATALCFPSVGLALGLGDIELQSALNQRLDAEIPLRGVPADQSGDINVELASEQAFQDAGLQRPYSLTKLRFRVKENDQGGYYVDVTSTEPIVEPFLTFLVKVDWPAGNLLREYTVLLDPPVFASKESKDPGTGQQAQAADPGDTADAGVPGEIERSADKEQTGTASGQDAQGTTTEGQDTQTAEAGSGTGGADADTETATDASDDGGDTPVFLEVEREQEAQQRRRKQQAQSSEDAKAAKRKQKAQGEQDREKGQRAEYGPVRKGEALWNIASRLKAGDVSVQQMMVALLRYNPKAFAGDNINRLKQGYVLRVPDMDKVRRISAQKAVAQVGEQNAMWKEWRQAQTGGKTRQAAPTKTAEAKSSQGASGKDETKLEIVGSDKGGASSDEKASATASGDKTKAEKLKLAREQLESVKMEKKELASRVAELENTVKKMEKLITLREEKLSKLQNQLDKLRAKRDGGDDTKVAEADTGDGGQANGASTGSGDQGSASPKKADEKTKSDKGEKKKGETKQAGQGDGAQASGEGQKKADKGQDTGDKPDQTEQTGDQKGDKPDKAGDQNKQGDEQDDTKVAEADSGGDGETTSAAASSDGSGSGGSGSSGSATSDGSSGGSGSATASDSASAEGSGGEAGASDSASTSDGGAATAEGQQGGEQAAEGGRVQTTRTQPAQKGWLDTLTGIGGAAAGVVGGLFAGGPMSPGVIGLVVIVILALVGVLVMRRRRAQAEQGEESEAPAEAGTLDEGDDLDTFAADTATEALAEEPESATQADTESAEAAESALMEESFDLSALEGGDETETAGLAEEEEEAAKDDTVAEADVYLAYGLHQQAEDVLRLALKESPDRADYQEKLLETLYGGGKRDEFVSEAHTYQGMVDTGSSRGWQRVVAMGREIAPDHELFSGAGDPGVSPEDLQPSKPESADFELDADSGEPSLDFSLDADAGGGAAEGDQGGDMSETMMLDTGDFEVGSEQGEPGQGSASGDDEGGEEFEFDLGELEDFAESGDESEAAPSSADSGGATTESEGESGDAFDFDLGDLDLDTSDAGDAEPSPSESGATAGEAEADLEFDLEGGAHQEEPAVADRDTGGGDQEFDLGDLDFGDQGTSDLESAQPEGDSGSASGGAETASAESDFDFDLDGLGEIEGTADESDANDLDAEFMGGGSAEAAATTEPSSSEDTALDFDITSLETESGETSASASTRGVSTETASDVGESSGSDEGELTSEEEEFDTMLDLAKAYIDMGDADSAGNALQEVIEAGNEAQRREAEKLLETVQ